MGFPIGSSSWEGKEKIISYKAYLREQDILQGFFDIPFLAAERILLNSFCMRKIFKHEVYSVKFYTHSRRYKIIQVTVINASDVCCYRQSQNF
jgi:hypothetical protein